MVDEKVIVFEATEEEYQAGLEKGWTDDDMLPPGKHVFHEFRLIASRTRKTFRRGT